MPLEMKYFVLKPKAKSETDIYALASQRAMLRYAETIEHADKALAQELRAWVRRELLEEKVDA